MLVLDCKWKKRVQAKEIQRRLRLMIEEMTCSPLFVKATEQAIAFLVINKNNSFEKKYCNPCLGCAFRELVYIKSLWDSKAAWMD